MSMLMSFKLVFTLLYFVILYKNVNFLQNCRLQIFLHKSKLGIFFRRLLSYTFLSLVLLDQIVIFNSIFLKFAKQMLIICRKFFVNIFCRHLIMTRQHPHPPKRRRRRRRRLTDASETLLLLNTVSAYHIHKHTHTHMF